MSTLHMNQFYKTKTCPWYYIGKCERGLACRFAHNDIERRILPDLSRTSLCPTFIKKGTCNDSSCRFAHQLEQLRATNTLYKTSLCYMFMRSKCQAGSHCRHAHGVHELRTENGQLQHPKYSNNNGVSPSLYKRVTKTAENSDDACMNPLRSKTNYTTTIHAKESYKQKKKHCNDKSARQQHSRNRSASFQTNKKTVPLKNIAKNKNKQAQVANQACDAENMNYLNYSILPHFQQTCCLKDNESSSFDKKLYTKQYQDNNELKTLDDIMRNFYVERELRSQSDTTTATTMTMQQTSRTHHCLDFSTETCTLNRSVETKKKDSEFFNYVSPRNYAEYGNNLTANTHNCLLASAHDSPTHLTPLNATYELLQRMSSTNSETTQQLKAIKIPTHPNTNCPCEQETQFYAASRSSSTQETASLHQLEGHYTSVHDKSTMYEKPVYDLRATDLIYPLNEIQYQNTCTDYLMKHTNNTYSNEAVNQTIKQDCLQQKGLLPELNQSLYHTFVHNNTTTPVKIVESSSGIEEQAKGKTADLLLTSSETDWESLSQRQYFCKKHNNYSNDAQMSKDNNKCNYFLTFLKSLRTLTERESRTPTSTQLEMEDLLYHGKYKTEFETTAASTATATPNYASYPLEEDHQKYYLWENWNQLVFPPMLNLHNNSNKNETKNDSDILKIFKDDDQENSTLSPLWLNGQAAIEAIASPSDPYWNCLKQTVPPYSPV